MTAPSTVNVQKAIEHIYFLVHSFQKPKLKSDLANPIPKVPKASKKKKGGASSRGDAEEEPEEDCGGRPSTSVFSAHKRSLPAAEQGRSQPPTKYRKKGGASQKRSYGDDSDEGSDPSAESDN